MRVGRWGLGVREVGRVKGRCLLLSSEKSSANTILPRVGTCKRTSASSLGVSKRCCNSAPLRLNVALHLSCESGRSGGFSARMAALSGPTSSMGSTNLKAKKTNIAEL